MTPLLPTLIIGYLTLSVVIALFSLKKRIGFGTAMAVSIFLTPITGAIAVIKSDNFLQVSKHVTRYTCPVCHMEFTEHQKVCPLCKEDQLEIKLLEVKHLQTA